MSPNTKTLVVTVLDQDPSITMDMKMLALKVLGGSVKEVRGGSVEPLIVSRGEAARIMGVSPKRVDVYMSAGKLKRVYMMGGKKATGILRSSIDSAVMAGVR